MKVTNNGKGLTIEADYVESAILTEALRKSVLAYEQENSKEFADEAREIISDLINNQVV
ncbi:hypothetical protein [Alkalibacillus silvisoli]|uniref:Uncharacterized protein n=1 Tax=Alkalibacillus silvisoli TaxID=392823 RepID=A0ABP3K6K8_9BACI